MDPSGPLQSTRAQPTGAVPNPHEPEAQWSSKSTTKDKRWVGDKVQVAETVPEPPREPGEPTANFLTAILTQNAPASDTAGLAQVLSEQEELGLEAPAVLYVDGAYVGSETLQHAQVQGRELRGPAPASPDRGKVDYRIEWNPATCGTCSLRDQCVSSGQNHRPLVGGALYSLRQARSSDSSRYTHRYFCDMMFGYEPDQCH